MEIRCDRTLDYAAGLPWPTGAVQRAALAEVFGAPAAHGRLRWVRGDGLRVGRPERVRDGELLLVMPRHRGHDPDELKPYFVRMADFSTGFAPHWIRFFARYNDSAESRALGALAACRRSDLLALLGRVSVADADLFDEPVATHPRPAFMSTWYSARRLAVAVPPNLPPVPVIASAVPVARHRRVSARRRLLATQSQSVAHAARVSTREASFRGTVLGRYGARCVVTGCDVAEVLDAAHLIPHADGQLSDPSNGLPMRVDVHRLFDRNLLGVDPSDMAVRLHPALTRCEYAGLSGKRVQSESGATPSVFALRFRWNEFLRQFDDAVAYAITGGER